MSLRSLLSQSLRLSLSTRSSPSPSSLTFKTCRRHLNVGGGGSGSVCLSRYPSYYIKPIYRDDDLERVTEAGELQALSYVPVRAAESDEVTSVWHDPLLNLFINMTMRKGQKALARQLIEKSFETMKRLQLQKYHEAQTDAERAKVILNPWLLFHKAIENARPMLETMPIKRGGSTYQVPIPVRETKSVFLAMKWIIEVSKEKPDEMRFYTKLAWELIDAANDTGRVVKRKQDLHKLCEANRAYAHFRWS